MSEVGFWLITIIMLLISIAVFIVPLYFGKDQNEIATRDTLNKALFHERMNELSHEEKEGIVQDKKELEIELKQALLDDIPEKEMNAEKKTLSFMMLFPGVLLIVGLSYFLYNVYGNYQAVTLWQEAFTRLPELSAKLMSDTEAEMTEQDMNDLILSLRTQLQKEPNDGTGWLLLGRIALSNRDILTASGAMEKAYRLMPHDTDVVIGYAQALMLTGDENNLLQSRDLLNGVIKKDQRNIQAISLLAFDAFERGAFDDAIKAWSRMIHILPSNDPRLSMLKRSIERAHAQMGTKQDKGKSVSVTISLAEGIIVPKDGVLIVSVHSAEGAPMPIAAKKLPLNQFPVTIDITDNDSMISERLLSSLSDVMVKARIDTDGNVMTKKGDWFGESLPFALGESSDILINKEH